MNKLFQTMTCAQDNVPTSSPQHSEQDVTRICIKDLQLDMLIGVYPEEQKKPQSVIVNLTLDVDPPANWQEDDINSVISYDVMVQDIQDLAARGQIGLVEHFAEEIAALALNDQRAQKVFVKIEKPEAIENTASVGVEIIRSRPLS